jgi:signal transduction histidine kinase
LDDLAAVLSTRLSFGRGRLDEFESLMGRHRTGVLMARHLDGWDGKPDAVLVEGLLDHAEGTAADDELLTGLGHHLETDLNAIVAELLNALHLERLDDVRCELGILREVLANLLDQLLGLVEVES